MKRILFLLLFVALAAGGYYLWQQTRRGNGDTNFRTTPIDRGNLVATISATGTLQPEEVIDVGARVVGQIINFGRDPKNTSKLIDFNTEVEEGTVLAEIDKRLYQADYDQALALVEQAKGEYVQAESFVEQGKVNILKAEADLGQLRAKLDQFEREWQRVQRIAERPGAIADTEIDLAKQNFLSAAKAVASGEAAVKVAEKTLPGLVGGVQKAKAVKEGAEAALRRSKVNLDFCTITSPVKGVIIDRRVNIGQTIVSVQNAPSLFLIAKDLRNMVIWSLVNEADVGQLKVGQKVKFTVEGRTGEVFKGLVNQIRKAPTPNQNVVLYTVVVSIDNNDGSLIAYQTCNVTFEIDRRENVLMVANGALRWQPRRELVDPEFHDELSRLYRRRGNPKAGSTEKDLKEGVVWVENDNGLVRPIKVKTGLTDGQMTEIISDELKEKDRLIIGIQQAKTVDDEANPFQPRMMGSRKPPQ